MKALWNGLLIENSHQQESEERLEALRCLAGRGAVAEVRDAWNVETKASVESIVALRAERSADALEAAMNIIVALCTVEYGGRNVYVLPAYSKVLMYFKVRRLNSLGICRAYRLGRCASNPHSV